MPILTIELPNMFGDHHVIEVRRLLLELPGVEKVYASSSFQIVEITFDETQVELVTIEDTLDQAGYLGPIISPTESGKAATEEGNHTYFRHTAAFEQTGTAVGFTQLVPYAGRPLWPCPGMGPVQIEEEEKTHG
ncbi:MAG: heavy-metal-associated domain-containing protein [Candidatus Promineifilaceae bacterium]|nr:heavy-metal-associated domain-containing protein [Candidatus Promineifilaceae bacterium]